jgi:hypothetical protein
MNSADVPAAGNAPRSTATCERCGAQKTVSPSGRSEWCSPCHRTRLRLRREVGLGATPADLAGARERLAAAIDAMPTEYLFDRLATLLDRSVLFGMTMRRASDVDGRAGVV